jgi:hypothetical protein
MQQGLNIFDTHKTNLMQICKSKPVPLHAVEAPGGRGGIAPTHT